MVESKKNNTGAKKKKVATSKKENIPAASRSGKKSTTSSKGLTSKTKEGGAKKAAKATKKTGKSTQQSQKAKLKVRVTKEDVSGIEESMEETLQKRQSSQKNKKNSDHSKAKGKKSNTPQVNFKDSGLQEVSSGPKHKKEKNNKQDTKRFKKRNIASGENKDNNRFSLSIKPKSISLYKKMAFIFILLTLILVGTFCYFSFVNLTITITPQNERISDNMVVNVYNDEGENNSPYLNNDIVGAVEVLEVQESSIYQSSGEEVTGKEIQGKVRIINNYSQNQPLIASTRLLSPNNKLYRIEKTVNVQAGGSVEVEVYTQDPSPEMAIGETEFNIPGLWAGLQDKIYAKSLGSFTYNIQKEFSVQESDIKRRVSNLKQKIIKKIEQQFANGYKGYDEVIYNIEEDSISIETDKKAGEEGEEFSASIKAKVDIVAFDNNKIITAAKKRLISRIPNGKQLFGFNQDNMNYSINSFNNKPTIVEVNFSGTMIPEKGTTIIDKKDILGLNKNQLKDYLDSFKNISDYKINFTPSFVNEVPALVDRINIKVQE